MSSRPVDPDAVEIAPEDKYYKVPRSRLIDRRRGLPRRPIFYTEDQVAAMLALSVVDLRRSYIYRVGEHRGAYRTSYLRCVPLPVDDSRPSELRKSGHKRDWRIAEGELIRWLNFHDLWLYDPLGISTDLPRGISEPTEKHEVLIDPERRDAMPVDEEPDPDLADL